MNPTALMQLGTQALSAAYQQLHTAGNNIANANTVGYSRQQAVQTTSPSLYTGSGYMGTGVTVATVKRATNLFLTQQAAALKSTSTSDAAVSDLLGQLEQIFPGGQAGLGMATTQVFNAFSDLAAAPADLSARQAVIGSLDSFGSLVRASSDQVESLQANVQSDLAGGVAEVNTLAKQLAALNGQISQAASTGQPPNDLLDQRDQLVSRISEQIGLQTVNAPDGSVAVFIATGQTLVLGTQANQLTMQPNEFDPARQSVGISIAGKLTQLSDGLIEGGRIGGLLQFQGNDLADARNRLGQFVSGVGSALNSQQQRGIDLNGRPGAPLLNLGAPVALPATSNARDGNGNPVSSIVLEVADASQLQASDYQLAAAADGSFTLTRLSDGLVRTGVASGDVVDGLRISAGATAPAAGERFLLRGVGAVASTIGVALRDPRGLAAAGPVTAQTDPANTGTLRVASVDVVAAPDSAYAATTLRFNDAAGDYDILDASDSVVGSGSFTAGQPIVQNGVAVSITGVPRAGDRLALAPTLQPASNNSNALTQDGLARQPLVAGQTASDAYASLFSSVGVSAQGAIAAAGNSGKAASSASSALSNQVGVNIDEEAARMIQYQQSYQAAAKILQTAQAMFDALLTATSTA